MTDDLLTTVPPTAAESLAGFVLVSWSASFTYLVMERFWGQRR